MVQPRSSRRVLPRRWVIFLAVLPFYLFALVMAFVLALFVIAVDDWADVRPMEALETLGQMLGDPAFWAYFGGTAAIVTAVQMVFLIPVLSDVPPRRDRSHSLRVSLVLIALVAAALTAGIGFALVEVFELWIGMTIEEARIGWVIAVPLVMLVVGWALWSVVLLIFVRDIWADRTLGRLIGLLLAGSLLEVVTVLPLDIMVRRRTDCYCGEGTFFTLCLAAVAGIVLTGPGIVIALTSSKHRSWRTTHCNGCGHPMGPTPGANCPECGDPRP